MNAHGRDVNESLRALGEAHRLGRLCRSEYRARRRCLLGTLLGEEGVTARQAMIRGPGRQELRQRRGPAIWRMMLIRRLPLVCAWVWLAAALACALFAGWLLD